jgi:hypothetical protein
VRWLDQGGYLERMGGPGNGSLAQYYCASGPAIILSAATQPPAKLVERSMILLSLDVLDAKLVGPARQEFIELRLGAHGRPRLWRR